MTWMECIPNKEERGSQLLSGEKLSPQTLCTKDGSKARIIALLIKSLKITIRGLAKILVGCGKRCDGYLARVSSKGFPSSSPSSAAMSSVVSSESEASFFNGGEWKSV